MDVVEKVNFRNKFCFLCFYYCVWTGDAPVRWSLSVLFSFNLNQITSIIPPCSSMRRKPLL